MTKQQTKHMISNLKTREDVANFWDTHSAADYKEELEPVILTSAKHLTRTMNVRFDEHDLEKLQEVAEQKGVGPSTLARMWIKERLHNNP
jgi:predicted HicB family RNase H-like nuclease